MHKLCQNLANSFHQSRIEIAKIKTRQSSFSCLSLARLVLRWYGIMAFLARLDYFKDKFAQKVVAVWVFAYMKYSS